ncbi:MAG: hypothetical protein QOH80_1619 [Actinomycetota bacterium]|nr:hypothetical protein [Actinomycetota bacterium]
MQQVQMRRRPAASNRDEPTSSPTMTAPRAGSEAVDSLLLEIDELLA